MNRSIALSIVVGLGLTTLVCAQTIDLTGSWAFRIDPNDVGADQHWYAKELPDRIHLPGALQHQGFGHEVTVDTQWTGAAKLETWLNESRYEKYRQPDNIKVPFCLQPEKHYVGPAWYQREVNIPTTWSDKHVILTVERPHWETRLWLDGRYVDRNDSLCTPHEYDLGPLASGQHVLTLRIDNRVLIDVGDWSHSVSDHTQTNWNGIIGRMELSMRPDLWIEDLQVFPDVATRSVLVKGRLGHVTGQAGQGELTVSVSQLQGTKAQTPSPVTIPVSWTVDGGAFECRFPERGRLQLWDEFHPVLYQLTASLGEGDDSKSVTFGLREITTTPDKLFAVNGRKTFLRGTLECCIFPLTGYPPMDVESWERVIRRCKAHGLNHIRFHSWCPPEAAFVAADRLGFYYQVECGVWTNPGNGTPVDQWLWDESERIVHAYGNHPSFVLFASGNEPHGPKREEYLQKWVTHWKEKDPRRLCTTAAAYPLMPVSDYHIAHAPRGPKGWGGKDYTNEVRAYDVPVIVHEMGQWCVYPNFDEIVKYTGSLKAKNFEIFRDSLTEHGLLDQWRDFLRASGRLQVICYKEEIEAALRTPGISGIQLLDLHDFPGQGTALVGVLDAFWDSKGYVTPEEFRRFYGSTIPLARMEKRVWTRDESFTAEVTIAHFGPGPLENVAPFWRLIDDSGKTVTDGTWSARDIAVDRGIEIGRIAFDWQTLFSGMNQGADARTYRLIVGIKNTAIENDWRLWVYPTTVETQPRDVQIRSELDEPALAHLADGGKVLLLVAKPAAESPKGSFTPIFWNRYMFDTQQIQTLGLLCDPSHSALKQFPTSFHSDWQWAGILSESYALVMDELPGQLRPIVQVIDDWNTNRKLGLVFEGRLGKGKLLVCSAELRGDLNDRPAARQLRRSLLTYMASDRFDPKIQVTSDQLATLFGKPSTLEKLGATATTDSAQAGYEASRAIDGDPTTIWHTAWEPVDPLPHHITIDLKESSLVHGLEYLPRQDMTNGRIAEYELHASANGVTWQRVAAGQWPNSPDLKTIGFKQPVTTRYLKLMALREVSGQGFISAAELDVILE